jgi:3',5'-cyclic-nucleotide phosphodiesterase
MSKHFDLVSYLRAKYSESVDFMNGDSRTDFFKLFIKAADVGHAAKALELHQSWCKLVIEEFYAQGDLEKNRGFPVSMFCDRENTNVPKAGFIKNIVQGLYETLYIVVNSEEIERSCIKQLKINLKYWETLYMTKALSSTEREDKI